MSIGLGDIYLINVFPILGFWFGLVRFAVFLLDWLGFEHPLSNPCFCGRCRVLNKINYSLLIHFNVWRDKEEISTKINKSLLICRYCNTLFFFIEIQSAKL